MNWGRQGDSGSQRLGHHHSIIITPSQEVAADIAPQGKKSLEQARKQVPLPTPLAHRCGSSQDAPLPLTLGTTLMYSRKVLRRVTFALEPSARVGFLLSVFTLWGNERAPPRCPLTALPVPRQPRGTPACEQVPPRTHMIRMRQRKRRVVTPTPRHTPLENTVGAKPPSSARKGKVWGLLSPLPHQAAPLAARRRLSPLHPVTFNPSAFSLPRLLSCPAPAPAPPSGHQWAGGPHLAAAAAGPARSGPRGHSRPRS